MRIYTKAGDLAFKLFNFPDSQPHFKLETYEIDFRSCTIEAAIRTPAELFQALMVAQTLRQHGYSEINLDVRYLMGARMDRAIASDQPFTLDLVARLINSAGFSQVRILDPHSPACERLIRNARGVLPLAQVSQIRGSLGNPIVVIPDLGANERVMSYLKDKQYAVQCTKVRDPNTGALSGFSVPLDPKTGKNSLLDGKNCLIIDDICDGGRTFTGIARELKKAGARNVFLFVTHGIFSNGVPLDGIAQVFTTNSFYGDRSPGDPFAHHGWDDNTVTIPISMKEMA